MLSLVACLICIGSGIVGGVFFAFSNFVMKALRDLPAHAGVAAMNRINVTVLNPLFLLVFTGTAVVSLVCVVAAILSWSVPRSPLLLAAGGLYLLGSFLVTLRFNVPRNDRLARMDATSAEAASYWPVYLREWTAWNHVRTTASIGSAACAAASLAL